MNICSRVGELNSEQEEEDEVDSYSPESGRSLAKSIDGWFFFIHSVMQKMFIKFNWYRSPCESTDRTSACSAAFLCSVRKKGIVYT